MQKQLRAKLSSCIKSLPAKESSCNFVPSCKNGFVQFSTLVQIWQLPAYSIPTITFITIYKPIRFYTDWSIFMVHQFHLLRKATKARNFVVGVIKLLFISFFKQIQLKIYNFQVVFDVNNNWTCFRLFKCFSIKIKIKKQFIQNKVKFLNFAMLLKYYNKK